MSDAKDPHGIHKVVYEELRRDALKLLARHTPGHSVTPSVLVHDAYMRLKLSDGGAFESELHFRAAAALAMRHVLVDRARERGAVKRGRGWARVTLQNFDGAESPLDVDFIALDEALDALQGIDAEGATIVQLRFFGDLTNDEVAATMGLSLRHVERSWRASRAWLLDRLAST